MLVLCRAACWLYRADVSLDSDEAIIGLMAKHLLEGRAFPLFYYGQGYLLGVEAWVAVPVFALFGASAPALRATLVAMNLALAWLLVVALVRAGKLDPWVALLAAGFVIVPAPDTSGILLHAGGMSVEPFIAVVVMWLVRRRPVAFGIVLALGFMNREFVAYGLAGLLLIEAADGTLFRRQGLVNRTASLAVAAVVWWLVQALRPYSSPTGPGSSGESVLSAGTSLTHALGFVTVSPDRFAADLWALLSVHLPLLFGARGSASTSVELSGTWASVPYSWWILVAVLAIAFAGAARRLAADRSALRTERVQFPVYLVLSGLAAAAGYALLRSGAMNPATVRYALLTLLAPTGLLALLLVLVPAGRLRAVVVLGAAAWLGVCAADDIRVSAAWLLDPPMSRRAAVCRDLVANHVKYGAADYWTAYAVSFTSGERVKLTATDIVRIAEYERLFLAHPDEAIEVLTEPCIGCRKVADVWIAPVRR